MSNIRRFIQLIDWWAGVRTYASICTRALNNQVKKMIQVVCSRTHICNTTRYSELVQQSTKTRSKIAKKLTTFGTFQYNLHPSDRLVSRVKQGKKPTKRYIHKSKIRSLRSVFIAYFVLLYVISRARVDYRRQITIAKEYTRYAIVRISKSRTRVKSNNNRSITHTYTRTHKRPPTIISYQ